VLYLEVLCACSLGWETEQEVAPLALVGGEEVFSPEVLEVRFGDHAIGALGQPVEGLVRVCLAVAEQGLDGHVLATVDEVVTGGVVGVEHELHILLLPVGEVLAGLDGLQGVLPHGHPLSLLHDVVLVLVGAGPQSLPDLVEGDLGLAVLLVALAPVVQLADFIDGVGEVLEIDDTVLVRVVQTLVDVLDLLQLEISETHGC